MDRKRISPATCFISFAACGLRLAETRTRGATRRTKRDNESGKSP